MNIIVIAFLITAFFLFESAFTVYRLHRDAALNRVCALLLMLFTVLCVIFALFVSERGHDAAWMLSKFSVILSCFVGSITLHFLLLLGGYESLKGKKILIALLYVPAVVLAIYAVMQNLVVVDVYLTGFGWDNRPRSELTVWDAVYFLYSMGFIAVGIAAVVVKSIFFTVDDLAKKQNLAFMKFSGVGLFTVIISSLFLTYLYNDTSPDVMILVSDLSQAGFLMVWLVGLRYVMWKYKLLVVLPSCHTGELLSGFSTPILLIDGREEIIFANKEALNIISPEPENNEAVVGLSLKKLMDNFTALEGEYEKITGGMTSHLTCTVRFNLGDEKRKSGYFQVQMYPIRNEGNYYIGSLIIINPSPGFSFLRSQYALTDREMEIVRFLDQGLSAPAIGGLLSVSELTVKTHIHNIYQKTGAKNRIGLSHLIRN